MQIEYRKEWMDTFLWILPDHPAEESYEEGMIKQNPGGGWLEFSREQREGLDYFCYKVTGKKALNSIYAAIPIGERQIRGILKQLFATLEEGREYLLSEEDFLLSPNYIFAVLPQMELEFCYVPGHGVPLKEQLEGLFEYLLNRVDYEDKQAVNLLYDCYMFCMKEKGGLAEIKKLLEAKQPEHKEEEVLSRGEISPVSVPRQNVQPVLLPESQRGSWQEPKHVLYPEPEEIREKKTSSSYVSWLTDKLFHRFRKEVPLVAEEREEYRAESMSEATERTVLLSAGKKPAGPELVCEQTGEVVPVSKYPFYIGSAKEYADFVPTGEGISRIHCCINKKKDSYYLADLNSTNGTYLNGQEVIPGKDALLSENDEIRVSSQEFYIKFPCH